MISGNYADANFLGTGRRVSVDLNSGQYAKVYGLSVTEPISPPTTSALQQPELSRPDAVRFVGLDFRQRLLAAAFDVGYPISEAQGVRYGLSFQKSSLLVTNSGSARQSIEWVSQNGNPSQDCLGLASQPVDCAGPAALRIYNTDYRTIEFTTSWNFDSRNRSLFADRGMRHSFGLAWALPGVSEVEYYVASDEYLQYIPLFWRFTLQLGADLAFGMDIGDTSALPPYRQFYAGGPETVRGYKESRLGPKDDFGNPFGGNLKVAGRAEVLIPLPQKFQTSARLSWFMTWATSSRRATATRSMGRRVSRSSMSSSMIN
jgi:outer membrane protein insertion porin family